MDSNQTIPKKALGENKRKIGRCKFIEIPQPLKVSQDSATYIIASDIPFREHNGRLTTEISFFNEVKNVQDVLISELFEQKVITIRLSQISERKSPSESELVAHLTSSGNPESIVWANLVKGFCHTYNKVMQRQSRKKMKSGPRKKFFAQVTLETEQRKKILFEVLPCLQLKFRVRNHQNQLREMLINEKWVQCLGHSADSFTTKVLQEGLPQLMPYDNPLAEFVMKTLIKDYFTVGERGNEIPELESKLIIKNNFARNIKFRTFFFMNYEENTFGMDIILAISAIGEPYLLPSSSQKQQFDEGFIQAMTQQEKEGAHFLSSYYNQILQQRYADIDKTCLIREINSDEDESICVPKKEENS